MPPGASELSSDARTQLLNAVRCVLRPIVRLLLRLGLSFDEFANVAQGAYIESALREHPNGIPPTRERIAFVTGLSRPQVDYFIDNDQALPVAGPTLEQLAVAVVHRWYTDPNYLGPYGIPLELEFDSPQGRCLQSLVAEINPTASPGKVLEVLIRAGSVAHFGEKHFRAITRWVIDPEVLSPSRIEYFGRALTCLAQTIEHNFNLMDSENKRLERCVFADRGLPRKLLPSFEEHARERANHFLLDIDDWIAHSGGAQYNGSGLRMDAGVNVFLYVEPASEQQALSSLVQPPCKDRIFDGGGARP